MHKRRHALSHRACPRQATTRTMHTLFDLHGAGQEQQAELVALLRDAQRRG